MSALVALWLACAPPEPTLPPPPAGTVSVESLLLEQVDRLAVAEPVAWTLWQDSSRDPRSLEPGEATWFANDDRGHFGGEHPGGPGEATAERVLVDREGPGAILRMWSANPEAAGTLRIYVDHGAKPVLELPLQTWLRPEAPFPFPLAETEGGGHNLWAPLPYAEHVRITVDRGGGLYWIVQGRRYPVGTPVESLSEAVLTRAKTALEATARALRRPGDPAAQPVALRPPTETTQVLEHAAVVAPGQALELALPAGPATVRALRLRASEDGEKPDLERIWLRLAFDGAPPSEAPLGFLFATGTTPTVWEGWWRTITPDGELVLRLPMPYADSAVLWVVNRSDTPLPLAATAEVTAGPAAPGRLELATRPRQTLSTRPLSDWTLFQAEGAGSYVLDALIVDNPVDAWWGEGDEKIYVDRIYPVRPPAAAGGGAPTDAAALLPDHFGTGTEDYYGYAYCDNSPFTVTFRAQVLAPDTEGPRCANNRGRSAVTRARSLDRLPFTRSLQVDLEVWHKAETIVDYAGAAAWYRFEAEGTAP